MKTRTLIAASLLFASAANAATVWIDFGDTASPSSPNINNIDQIQNPLFNLVDRSGAGTGIGVNISDVFWPGSNQNGTSAPTGEALALGIPVTATRDNLFGNTVAFGGFTEPTGGFYLTGLDTSGMIVYDFAFFGSRTGVSDNRVTRYAATGANSGFDILNCSNNTGNLAHVIGIQADAFGQIYIDVRPDATNNNASGFYYLGFLQIISRPVPAPGVIAALGAAGLLTSGRRRR